MHGQDIHIKLSKSWDIELWASQAEHFARHMRRKPGEYEPIQKLHFEVTSYATEDTPDAFLFVAPPHVVFRPDTIMQEVAYWSFRADGSRRLTTEQARTLNLPEIRIFTGIQCTSWPNMFYEMIRAVHQARGFDPYSTEIAEHLGYPILEFLTPAKPRVNKVHFFDTHWEDGDTSIADLFSISDLCYEEPDVEAEQPGVFLAWMHVLLIVAGLLMQMQKYVLG